MFSSLFSALVAWLRFFAPYWVIAVCSGCLAGLPFAPADELPAECPDVVIYWTLHADTLAADSIVYEPECPAPRPARRPS